MHEDREDEVIAQAYQVEFVRRRDHVRVKADSCHEVLTSLPGSPKLVEEDNGPNGLERRRLEEICDGVLVGVSDSGQRPSEKTARVEKGDESRTSREECLECTIEPRPCEQPPSVSSWHVTSSRLVVAHGEQAMPRDAKECREPVRVRSVPRLPKGEALGIEARAVNDSKVVGAFEEDRDGLHGLRSCWHNRENVLERRDGRSGKGDVGLGELGEGLWRCRRVRILKLRGTKRQYHRGPEANKALLLTALHVAAMSTPGETCAETVPVKRSRERISASEWRFAGRCPVPRGEEHVGDEGLEEEP